MDEADKEMERMDMMHSMDLKGQPHENLVPPDQRALNL
jgi:hypothetical protein